MWRPVLLLICTVGAAILAQNRTISFLGGDPGGIFLGGLIGFIAGMVLVVILESLFPDDSPSIF